MNILRVIVRLFKTKNNQTVSPPTSDLAQIDPETGQKSYAYNDGNWIERLTRKKWWNLGNPNLVLNVVQERIEIYTRFGKAPKIFYINNIDLEPGGAWGLWKKFEKITFYQKSSGKEIVVFKSLISPDELIEKFRKIEEAQNCN
jgi:hypothetical protein